MSRENLDLVARIYEALAADDLDTALGYLDPEIEWCEPPQSPGAGVYHGLDGVRRSYEHWVGGWASYKLEVEELVDAGEHVLAKCRQRVRGRASGVEVDQPLFSAWSLRDGMAIRMRMYHDEQEALAAVGLG